MSLLVGLLRGVGASSSGTSVSGVVDANGAPYNCSTAASGATNSAGLTAAIADAVAAAIATNGTSAIVELDSGEYDVTRAPVTTDGCYAQIPLPKVARTSQRVALVIRPKQGAAAAAGLFFATQAKTPVVLRSTRTGESYSGTNGWPSIMGGPDTVHGTTILTDASWMTLHLQGIAFRQPANPSMCCVNAALIDRAIFEDWRCDTTDADATGHYPTTPTTPGGIANLPPINTLDGLQYRGFTEVAGYYGGPAVGELMVNTGTIFSYENYIALTVPGAFTHSANLGHCILCRNSIALASVSSGGIGAVPALEAPGTPIIGVLNIEDDMAGTWRRPAYHVYDPTSQLVGRVTTFRSDATAGSHSDPLWIAGGNKITQTDMLEHIGNAPIARDSFSRADSASSPGSLEYPSAAWTVLSGTWGIDAGALYYPGADGVSALVYDAGLASCTVSCVVKLSATRSVAMLIVRAVDDSNYLLVEVSKSGSLNVIDIYSKIAGVYTELATASAGVATLGQTIDFKVVLSGNNITGYVNNVQKVTASTAQFNTATKHGIGINRGAVADDGTTRWLDYRVRP